MPDICSKSQTYNVPSRSTGTGVNLAGYPSGAKQVRTSVSMAPMSEERGGFRSVNRRGIGTNRMQTNRPQYRGKKIR